MCIVIFISHIFSFSVILYYLYTIIAFIDILN